MDFAPNTADTVIPEKDSQNSFGKKIQLIIFKLGSEEYGLTIDQIKEVVLTPSIAHVPHMPSYIKGVANIRGNIIAIIDLEERFSLHNNENTISNEAANYTLVVESNTLKVGILVKEVPNTLSILSSDIDDAKGFIQFSTIDENCIKGIVKTGDRLIILIDVFKIMDLEKLQVHQLTKEKQ